MLPYHFWYAAPDGLIDEMLVLNPCESLNTLHSKLIVCVKTLLLIIHSSVAPSCGVADARASAKC